MKRIEMRYGLQHTHTEGGIPLADAVMRGGQVYLVTGAVFCEACSATAPRDMYHLFAEFWDISSGYPEPIGSFMVFNNDNNHFAGVAKRDVERYARSLITVWEITAQEAPSDREVVSFMRELYEAYAAWTGEIFTDRINQVAQTLGITADEVYDMLQTEEGFGALNDLITQHMDDLRQKRASMAHSFDIFSGVRSFSVN